MKTFGTAHWDGGFKDGHGAISTKSGAMKEYPYGVAARFEGKAGTNPEELIGAAHAGCFTMALAMMLGLENLTAEHMDTRRQDGASHREGQGPRNERGGVPRDRHQGQGELPDLQAAERDDHDGGLADVLKVPVGPETAEWGNAEAAADREIDPNARAPYLRGNPPA